VDRITTYTLEARNNVYEVSPNKLIVQFFDSKTDSAGIMNVFQKMTVKTRKATNLRYFDDLMLVELENMPKEQIVKLIDKWVSSEKDTYVSPILSCDGGIEVSFIPDQILVQIKQKNDYSILLRKLQSYSVKSIELSDFDAQTYLVKINDANRKNSMQIANELHESGLFAYAEPNMLHFVKRQTNDTHYNQQWGLHGTAGIKAPQAWTLSTGSQNIRIAYLDSGVDVNHPDLVGNLLQGYNALTGALNGAFDVNDPEPPHGTACIGIASGLANNSIGIAGVAYNCRILPIVDGGNLTASNIIARAIRWARNNNADVISISNNYNSNNALNAAIDSAASLGRSGLGCVIIAASGNGINGIGTTNVGYPANRNNVISVGATTNQGIRAQFSNFGSDLDVVAPGVDIYSTGIIGYSGYGTVINNNANGVYFSGFTGTSAATPHVSGIAALILSKYPTLTRAKVRQAIESTCVKTHRYHAITNPTGYLYTNNPSVRPNGEWTSSVGYGLVDAYEAIPRIKGDDFLYTTATYTLNIADSNTPWTLTPDASSSGVFTLTNSTGATATVTAPAKTDGKA